MFDADQNAQFSPLTCFRFTFFLLNTKIGNFPDDFMSLNKWRHFSTEIGKFADNFMSWTRYASFIRWIFSIFLVRYIKTDSINWRNMPFLVKKNKKPKIASNWLALKLCDSDTMLKQNRNHWTLSTPFSSSARSPSEGSLPMIWPLFLWACGGWDTIWKGSWMWMGMGMLEWTAREQCPQRWYR